MFNYLGDKNQNFPRIDSRSKKQMKDVEMVAQLLLFLEEGAKTYSPDYLDTAFSDRDNEWEDKDDIESEFRQTVETIKRILDLSPENLFKTRLKNQADFYSLFGAVAELNRERDLTINEEVGKRIYDFIKTVEDKELQDKSKDELSHYQTKALTYYQAVKFAFTDANPRKTRINIMKSLIEGNLDHKKS